MMSTQMNNCRHVGFQNWESQTCETLAFQEEKKKKRSLSPRYSFCHFLSISLHFLSLSFSVCFQMAVG